MKRITPQYVRVVHEKVIKETGGVLGIRSVGLLESACARPFAGFGDFEAYPELVDKAAVLGAGIIQNHSFVDGNKRVGIVVTLALLRSHGIEVECTQEELVQMVLDLATGSSDWSEFADWIRRHCREEGV